MKKKYAKHPLLYLLRIPAILLLDVILLIFAVMADTYLVPSPEGFGHGTPAVTLVVFLILAVVTLIVCIHAVVMTVVHSIRKRQYRDLPEPFTATEPAQPPENPSKALLFLLIGPALAALGSLICGISVILELRALPQPEYGFKIPMFSLLLMMFFFVLTVIAVIVSIILTIIFYNRKKTNRKEALEP